MQVAAQAPALLGDPGHERPAAGLEVGREPQGVGDGRELAGEVVEQPAVARLELVLTGPGGHREHPQRLAVPAQGQLVRQAAVGVTGPLDDRAAVRQVDAQLDGGQPQRLAHLARDLLQRRPR